MLSVCRIMAAWAAAGAVENGGMLMYRYITKKKMNVRVLRELVISVAHKLSDDMVGRYDEVVTLKKVI